MRTRFLHWAIFSAPLLLVLAALWLGFDTEAGVSTFFHEHSAAHPTLSAALKFVTDWSNPLFYAFYGVMLVNAFRKGDAEKKRYVFILLGVQVVVSLLCVHFIKRTIGRPRPGQGWYFDPLTSRGNYHSLPSGHTTEITGWSLPLAFRLSAFAPTLGLGLFVGLVGFTRIYLGWHHPTDVFFGWLLGSFGGFATQILADSTLFRRKAGA
ncbi:phosphatase PAP2 family protein [Pseudodesulfovibrio cashew]|uniref:Phosphatase PAP2 family protein n=1 Tax=Pseudodesulfovibrio cashew TaxID=2678688 RepID=A0A6I6JDH1_9BACT|nr:phosphatase PAP2 family protein [Pseudodesulfovibrio cashew]QGY40171.1 phosphatase PAP2 family protein [Pseudodesulfovibrio cashew]